jgi:hypothetical protein
VSLAVCLHRKSALLSDVSTNRFTIDHRRRSRLKRHCSVHEANAAPIVQASLVSFRGTISVSTRTAKL